MHLKEENTLQKRSDEALVKTFKYCLRFVVIRINVFLKPSLQVEFTFYLIILYKEKD